MASVGCAFLSYFFLVPVYPTVARDLGVGADLLGAIVGAGQLVAAVIQVPAGVVADRVGRRPFLVGGLAVIAAAQVLRWAPAGVATFAVAQAGVGLCLPLIVSASSAAVVDAYARAGRAQALGILLASVNLGQVTGYLAMGELAGAAGWRQMSLALAVLPAGLLLLALGMPEPPRAPPPGSPGAQVRATARFLASPGPAAMLTVVALVVGVGNSSSYLLPFVNRSRGLGPGATSLLLLPYVAGSVVMAPLTGRLADRIGTRAPMLGWLSAGAVGVGGFALLGPGPAWAPPCYALLGGAVGSCTSLAAARMAELVTPRRDAGVGGALGGLRSAQSLGPALGPPLAALVYVTAGFRPAFLGLAGACLLALTAAALARPEPSAGRAAAYQHRPGGG